MRENAHNIAAYRHFTRNRANLSTWADEQANSYYELRMKEKAMYTGMYLLSLGGVVAEAVAGRLSPYTLLAITSQS